MKSRMTRNLTAFFAGVLSVAGCSAPQPKEDIRDPDARSLTGSEFDSATTADAKFHEDVIYLDTFRGTVGLIGLVDLGRGRLRESALATDLEAVDNLDADLLNIDGACMDSSNAKH
jgi:hypothetical protein